MRECRRIERQTFARSMIMVGANSTLAQRAFDLCKQKYGSRIGSIFDTSIAKAERMRTSLRLVELLKTLQFCPLRQILQLNSFPDAKI